MTRHNLDTHIAWLLSNQVLPRADAIPVFPASYSRPTEAANQQILGSQEGEGPEIDFVLSSLRDTRIAPGVDVDRDQGEFVRPPLPTFSSSIVADIRNTPMSSRKPQDVPMARLVSAPRSARPALMSQIQLATPASTTSTTAPSSLAQSYKKQLSESREAKSTPSIRNSGDQALNKPVRALQVPQTPRQIPRQNSGLTNERIKIESVDLTGDDYGAAMSRSSSSDVVWGETEELWNEPAATRPEPVSRTSKKRKSDDATTPRGVKRTNSRNTPTRMIETEDINMDDFVDIDELDLPVSRPAGTFTKMSGMGGVEASIEANERMDDIQEQMEFTETITRTETRTRKSVSRVPSVTSVVPGRSTSEVQIPGTPALGIFSDTNSSPAAKDIRLPARHTSPRLGGMRTPQKQTSRHFKSEILDSDDEECLSEIGRIAACSPSPVKKSPRPKVRSPSASVAQDFASPEHKLRNVTDSRPRVGSPLRSISINSVPRQEKIPSPFHQDSPSRRARSGKPGESQASGLVSRSSNDLDDKKVIDAYLGEPSTINVYRQRVSNLLVQSSIACMAFVDKQEAAPDHLRDQRIALLDMMKAYEALEALGKCYQITQANKKKIAKEIVDLLELSGDTSEQEEISSALTRDMRYIRTEVGRLLHSSGAVKDGFGTGYSSGAAFVTSSINDTADRANSATTGSAQIIMQTQFPSLPIVSTASSARASPAKASQGPSRAASPSRYQAASASVYDQGSPSPVRGTNAATYAEQSFSVSRETQNRPQQSFKQTSFRREPSPAPYDFDDEAFEDLLEEEKDIMNSQNTRLMEDTIQTREENYGDSDFDDDMEGIIQTVEKRHSSARIPSPIRSRPTTAPEGSRNVSEGSRVSQSKPRREKDMYSHVDVERSGLLKHAWSADVKRALKERFKLGGFRHHQLEAINATLSGQDAFVLMPTGGGKSLCYQLPAIVQSGKTKGITIVISPLLSLMKDQVKHLLKLHIRATTINSETTPEDKAEIIGNLKNKHPEQYLQLLYVTPEMMSKSEQMLRIFDKLYNNQKLARVVIDEAHCVSQWGHDFRPDYVALSSIRERFPGVPIMALTATATKNVQMDVIHNLGMKNCSLYAQSFNRPNLYYEVRRKKKGKSGELLEDMAKLISGKYKGQTGIIYTLSKRNCEDIAAKLYSEHKIKAYHFHAGMTPEEKSDTQDQWQSGEIQVVVATIAFGMGIDKANVRFVIHHMIPKSLEGYYQETGRAGRDGLKSGCYLYYGYADTTMLRKFIQDSEASNEQKERQRKMLQSMVAYCENESDCRRVQVLGYFNESFRKEDCKNTCDNCRSDAVFQDIDFSKLATAAVQVVKKVMGSNVTLLHCADILRGAKNKKIKDLTHEKLNQYGIAKDIERSDIERLLYRLVAEKALEEKNVMNGSGFPVQYIQLGRNHQGFLTGQRRITMQVQVSNNAPAPAARSKKAKVVKHPTSTMITSPMAPTVQKKKYSRRADPEDDDEYDYGDDMHDFIVSDNEVHMGYVEHERSRPNAFEKMQQPRTPKPRQLETRGGDMGPPIVSDQQVGGLTDIHRVLIQQFVEAAKRKEEEIRNGTTARRPFFSESNFREMAIRWTLNLAAMKNIPDINPERVSTYGKQFLPLIRGYNDEFNRIINEEEEERFPVPEDPNHRIVVPVVDLVSDEDDGEFDDDMRDEDMEEQATSQYFAQEKPRAPPTRSLPWATNYQSSSRGATKPHSARGSFTKGRGRGGSTRKASSSRKSFGSNSGASSAAPKRRSTGAAKKPRARTSAGSSSKGGLEKFSYQSGGGGGGSGYGGGGGGIGMMPT